MADYIPQAGDVVWLQFDPQAGHEQAGHRPALVLTPRRYNALRGMMICCPMTSRIKGYVFEVVVSRTPPSVVLADQMKSLDWRARGARFSSAVAPEVLAEVQGKVKALLALCEVRFSLPTLLHIRLYYQFLYLRYRVRLLLSRENMPIGTNSRFSHANLS